MNEQLPEVEWNVAEWHGKTLVDRDGEKIGKLEDIIESGRRLARR